MLRIDTSVLSEATLCSRSTALPDLANIPVIADVLFTETVENFVLPSTELLDPFAHVVQHFTLDLGAAIMEIWMEAKAA